MSSIKVLTACGSLAVKLKILERKRHIKLTVREMISGAITTDERILCIYSTRI